MVAEFKIRLKALTKLVPVACATAALGLVSASVASADYLSHRSPEQVFQKEDFSTWSPRKGKMSYENDASQPEYGQGRGRSYTKTCAQLAKFLGPDGKAMHGDVITVKPARGGDTCNFTTGLIITKGVTLQPFVPTGKSNPVITRVFADVHSRAWVRSADKAEAKWEKKNSISSQEDFYFAEEAPKYIAKMETEYRAGYNLHFDCSGVAGPCVTTNVPTGNRVTIKNTHIFRTSKLSAPLVETHRGGIILVNNFLEAKYSQPDGKNIPLILVHSHMAVLEGNLIADAFKAVSLKPAETYGASTYQINANIITNVSYGVDAAETKQLVVTGNLFGPNVRGAMFKIPAVFHVMVSNGEARINQNVFRNSLGAAIMNMPSSAVKINLDRNLFQKNAKVAFDIGGSLVRKSPFPTGNICKKQPFESFYNGRPHYTGFVTPYKNMMSQGKVDFVYTGPKKKTSKRKLKKSRRNETELWTGYDTYLAAAAKAIAKEQTKYRQVEDPKAKKRSSRKSKGPVYPARKGELWGEMWNVFRTFQAKQTESVGAHILFDKYGLSSKDGFTSCFDYSTLYKFAAAPDKR